MKNQTLPSIHSPPWFTHLNHTHNGMAFTREAIPKGPPARDVGQVLEGEVDGDTSPQLASISYPHGSLLYGVMEPLYARRIHLELISLAWACSGYNNPSCWFGLANLRTGLGSEYT